MNNQTISIKQAIRFCFNEFIANFGFYIKLLLIAFFLVLATSSISFLLPILLNLLPLTIKNTFIIQRIIIPLAWTSCLFMILIFVEQSYNATAIKRGLSELEDSSSAKSISISAFLKFIFTKQTLLFIAARTCYKLLVFAGLVLFIIPGIYIYFRYYFVGYSILDRNFNFQEDWSFAPSLSNNIKLKLAALDIIVAVISSLSYFTIIGAIFLPPFVLASTYIYKQRLQA